MISNNDKEGILGRFAPGTRGPTVDVFGPLIEFLTPEDNEQICVMRGVVPPGVTVPLHSHDDFEDFLILAGGHQVLVQGDGGLEWRDAKPGDYIRVAGNAPHAHRNLSDEPAVDLIVTTAAMGRFFREVGRPIGSPPPTAREVARFAEAAARFGYRLATAQENAAVGIAIPAFTA